MAEQSAPITEVHVVWHSESAHDNILGVFTDASEAKAYMGSIRNDYAGGVFSTLFPIGMKGTDPERRYLD